MAKKKKQEQTTLQETHEPAEMHTLVELFFNVPGDDAWKIYNISRKGLMQQFEQELKDYGQKHIEPTLTVEEFENIIQGKQ